MKDSDVNCRPRSLTTHPGSPALRTASRNNRTANPAVGSFGTTPIARTFLENASITAPTRTERKSPPTRVMSTSHTCPGRRARRGPCRFCPRGPFPAGRGGGRRSSLCTEDRETATPIRTRTAAAFRVPQRGHSRRRRWTSSPAISGSARPPRRARTRRAFPRSTARVQLRTVCVASTKARAVARTDSPCRARCQRIRSLSWGR